MKNKWDDVEAATHEGELGPLIYTTRLLGQEENFGHYVGGNASVKQTVKNLLGEEEEILFINHGQQPPGTIKANGFTPLRNKPLASLSKLEALPAALLENQLACSRTLASAPVPPANSLLHAVMPYRYILLSQPDAILAIANTHDGPLRLHQLYGEEVSILPYAPSGLALAKACAETLAADAAHKLAGIFVQHQGLVTYGETARLAYERLVDLVTRAELYLENHGAWNVTVTPPPADEEHPADKEHPEADKALRQELAALRQAISSTAGRPLILSVHMDPAILNFCRRDDLAALAGQGPAVVGHAVITKRLPMIGRDVDAYRVAREQDIGEYGARQSAQGYDVAPRIILDPELGMCALGYTAGQATLAGQVYRRTIDIILRATALDAYCSLSSVDAFTAEAPARSESGEASTASDTVFAGEIALVTGGASGIGKACVESLLARGAAVVSMDINPLVKTLFDRPDYLGLLCDLTDEMSVLSAFEALARCFGGLDMLVLNAGIFPGGCRIEALTLTEWQRVMRINLDSNLVVLREAHALLKHSPRGGRVLVNASKNVHAPGAGAAAYSSSKAAVTQLARVAALEWGKDHIRINQIHPDAIFDTGIWTEDVLKARAAHYGMSVQQYKTRNVLGVELKSHDVGELVAEMLGPRFEKITGAQIPVDGGSDRVI
jgi:rhamnose utilization protein RhaD (predicted bifunctional aldolase and dehydrogenase)/NAD(P)-dependent dehydrogenase (short-subunit alcohol dehydrogenase family)